MAAADTVPETVKEELSDAIAERKSLPTETLEEIPPAQAGTSEPAIVLPEKNVEVSQESPL